MGFADPPLGAGTKGSDANAWGFADPLPGTTTKGSRASAARGLGGCFTCCGVVGLFSRCWACCRVLCMIMVFTVR